MIIKKGLYTLMLLMLVVGMLLATVVYSAEPTGTLTISWPETFRAIDPHYHDNQKVFWAIIGQGIFDHLIERTADGQFVPGLATSWKNIEPIVWEFKLRKGVKFHNGEPFNAEAVKYTFERMVEKNAPCLFLFKNIKKVEIIDNYTVQIRTFQPFGVLPISLILAEIVPPVAGKKPEFSTHPIGTGPFKFEEWIKGEKFSMVANEDYWGEVPKVERVIHYPLLEQATRIAGFRSGKLDIIHAVPEEEISLLISLPDINVVTIPGNDTVSIVFNHAKKFGDIRVRKAMAYAINTKEIEEYILGEAGVPAKSVISPAIFGFKDVSKYLPDYNIAQAKKLLKEAGYPNGFSTNIIAPEGFYPKDREILEYIKDSLSKVGIDLKLRLIEPAAAWPFLDAKDFELFVAGWGALTMDADFGLYRNFHSSNTREGFANDLVDEMLEKGVSSVDPEVRKEAYGKAQVEIVEKLLRLPIYHPNIIYGISGRVEGFVARDDFLYDLINVSVKQ